MEAEARYAEEAGSVRGLVRYPDVKYESTVSRGPIGGDVCAWLLINRAGHLFS